MTRVSKQLRAWNALSYLHRHFSFPFLKMCSENSLLLTYHCFIHSKVEYCFLKDFEGGLRSHVRKNGGFTWPTRQPDPTDRRARQPGRVDRRARQSRAPHRSRENRGQGYGHHYWRWAASEANGGAATPRGRERERERRASSVRQLIKLQLG